VTQSIHTLISIAVQTVYIFKPSNLSILNGDLEDDRGTQPN
jgi:hypothetical protein